jgi:hypothetical protein
VKVVFFSSDKARERVLADAFLAGLRRHGDTGEMRVLTPDVQVAQDADVVAMCGVKSNERFHAHARAGIHTIMLDKGYTRHSVSGDIRAWEYWRVAVDHHHPTHYLMREKRPTDRLNRLGLDLRPWRKSGDHIVLAGSSAKYHAFYSLPDPTTWAKKMVRRFGRLAQGREIVYRPKTSWKEAEPVDGATFQQGGSIEDALKGAHALITHGSNACFEAVLNGVPCMILGDAVARPISTTVEEEIEKLRMVSDAERQQWLANLAYCQWTQRELASGEAWEHIRPVIYG